MVLWVFCEPFYTVAAVGTLAFTAEQPPAILGLYMLNEKLLY